MTCYMLRILTSSASGVHSQCRASVIIRYFSGILARELPAVSGVSLGDASLVLQDFHAYVSDDTAWTLQ
jgi:hypothetical protein